MKGKLLSNRRDFLKKSASISVTGVAGMMAATTSASAANSYEVQINGDNTNASRYVIKNDYGTFEEAENTNSSDWAGDRIVGKIAGGWDSYYHNGTIEYVNVAVGPNSSDGKISFDFPNGSGKITVNADAGTDWIYYVSATGGINKGSAADGNDDDYGGMIGGEIYGGYKDSYRFSGTIDYIEVHGFNTDVKVDLFRHRSHSQ